MSKVTVIIPTFNRAHLLLRAIQSVLNQTFRDYELIIVDDASRDNTEELVKNINDRRILYLRHESNKGASAARNTGLKKASGQFIAFLDSDDEWVPQKLEKQMTVFESSSERLGVVYAGFRKMANKYRDILPKYRGNILQDLLVINCVGTTSTPLIRKRCFQVAGYFDESLPSAQDWDMWIRISEHYEFEYVPEVLVLYYIQPESITMNYHKSVEGLKEITRRYKNRISELPRSIQAQHYFNMGKVFWWTRYLSGSLISFTRSCLLHPGTFVEIALFFMHGMASKIRKAKSVVP